MRRCLPIILLLLSVPLGRVAAQEAAGAQPPEHVAVEATTVVLDERRASRLGLDGLVLASPGDELATRGRGGSTVRVGSRVGGLDVTAWLELVRDGRAARRESTQRIVVLSGAAAELSGQHSLVGMYGEAVQAGPALWVQPVALEDGRVRLRLWTTVGDVRAARPGTLEQYVPVETSTEIVVPSGTPVLIAHSQLSDQRARSGLLERGSTSSSTEAWVVVTARVVGDPALAFPVPGEQRKL